MSYVNKGKYMVSSRLMDEISKSPINFEGMEDEQAIAVFVKLKTDLEIMNHKLDFYRDQALIKNRILKLNNIATWR